MLFIFDDGYKVKICEKRRDDDVVLQWAWISYLKHIIFYSFHSLYVRLSSTHDQGSRLDRGGLLNKSNFKRSEISYWGHHEEREVVAIH